MTISSTNGYWTLSLTPNGTGAYLARCLSATAPAAEALDLGQIEDDTDLPLAGLAEGAFANCQKLSGVISNNVAWRGGGAQKVSLRRCRVIGNRGADGTGRFEKDEARGIGT